MARNSSEIPRGSKEFERKLNKAAAEGVQAAIDRENARKVPWVEVDQETAYGRTSRLSNAIRVF